MAKVITWQTPQGRTINVCQDCEGQLTGAWPRDKRGEEYCQVHEGLHTGHCDVCDDDEDIVIDGELWWSPKDEEV